MSYSSFDAGYYTSSTDSRYRSSNGTTMPVYPSAGSYGAVHPSVYASSQNPPHNAIANISSGYFNQNSPSGYRSEGYPASASTARSQPTDVYYQNVAYPPCPSHYESQRSYSAYSANSFTAASPPTSPAYPASPPRPHQCDQCALSFDRSHDLKRHRESHSGARPFVCPSCDKSFTRKDALKRHQSQKQCGISAS